jgi:hypothetical protein
VQRGVEEHSASFKKAAVCLECVDRHACLEDNKATFKESDESQFLTKNILLATHGKSCESKDHELVASINSTVGQKVSKCRIMQKKILPKPKSDFSGLK